MKYADIRSQIKSGDVIACGHRGNMFASWYDFKIGMVRVFTRSKYSHVGFAYVIADRVFIMEAVSSGVRPYPLSLLKDFYLVKRGIWSDDMERRAFEQCGEPYSEEDCVDGYFGKEDNDTSHWQCAKYVKYVLQLALRKVTPASVMWQMEEVEGRHAVFVET